MTSQQSSLRSASVSPSSPSNKGLIPHDFFWNHGGTRVILTGTFDNWQKSVVMKPKLGDMTVFSATVYLDPIKDYQFKYVVDDVWRCSLDFPTITDNQGNVNNLLVASASASASTFSSTFASTSTVASAAVATTSILPPVLDSSQINKTTTENTSRRSSDESDPSHVKILRSDANGKVSGLVNLTDEPPRLKGSLKRQYSEKQQQQQLPTSVQNASQQRI